MRELTLEKLVIAGFKSYRDRTEIALSTGPGLKFIGGRNLVDKGLGANGAGKSSLFDAFFWCCQGVSTRGKKASDLVPLGVDRAEVEVHFLEQAGGEEARIILRRTSHPERIELNGARVEQREVDEFLGMKRAAFSQAFIYGQATPLFYDLPIPARGDLLDEVLNLSLWMSLSERASKKIAGIQGALVEVQRRIAHCQGQLDGLPNIEELREKATTWHEEHQAEIEGRIDEVDALEKEEAALKKQLVKARTLVDSEEFHSSLKSLNQIRQDMTLLSVNIGRKEDRIREIDRLLHFYENHENCPSCGQPLDNHFVEGEREKMRGDRGEEEKAIRRLYKSRQSMGSALRLAEEGTARRRELEHEAEKVRQQLLSLERQIDRAIKEVEKAEEVQDRNPYDEEIERAEARRTKLEADLRTMRRDEGKLTSQEARISYWKQGFKKVRLFEMRKILDRLELETANAASALGLIGWQVRFSTEIETKSGTMRPGVHIQIDAGEQNAPREWSPGELQRVRLAVTFGLAHLIQEMAGVVYRFEVFDEPTSWLSEEGTEGLLDHLHYRAEGSGRSIWLIDHRSFAHSAFDEVWMVTKRASGSSIKRIASEA